MEPKKSGNVLTWDELIASIQSAKEHPNNTLWHIYHYLKKYYTSLDSKIVRTLLFTYMKLRPEEPALINSCMLSLAAKISYQYQDFNFPEFLKYWGYGASMLRREDCIRQLLENGREMISLRDRVERALVSYGLHHPDCGLDSPSIRTFFAVKVFDTFDNGHKRHTVKLVDAEGCALIADSHLFPCRLSMIQGNIFDVITRMSKKADNHERAEEIVFSRKAITDLFKPIIGYVERFDVKHGHYHVYDSQSRHYVAEQSKVQTAAGCYILFCPIIIRNDNFKSAVILHAVSAEDGKRAFGMYEAVINMIDYTSRRFKYELKVCPPDPNADDTYSQEAFMPLELVTNASDVNPVKVGSNIGIVLFLKRGQDGIKHNHAIEAHLL